MLSVPTVLVPSVSDDDIAAELAAGLPPEEAAELHAARLHLALEDEAERSTVPAEGERSRRRAGDPRDLIEAAARVGPVALAREHLLPVAPELAVLLPDAALRRGTTVAVGSVGSGEVVGGATTLALSLVAAASAEGSWTALVGLPAVGLAAAAEVGLALERVAVIAAPPPEQWATVVAALVGAFDLVLVSVPPATRAGEVRRLAARSRERGSVLIQLEPLEPAVAAAGGPVEGAPPVRARGHPSAGLEVDVRLAITASWWDGLRDGAGHLQTRRVTVEASGRRAATRPRRADLWMPGPSGTIASVEVDPGPAPPAPVDRLPSGSRGNPDPTEDRVEELAG